jgi:hypothetical protein
MNTVLIQRPLHPHAPAHFIIKLGAQVSKREERGETDETDEDEDEDFKDCARYKKGRRGALFNVETRRRVVWDQEKLKIMKIVHEDLGH